MSGPSAHLSWKELACHDGTPYPPAWRLNRAVLLARAFECVRALYDQPIPVLSAYRSPAYNQQVGGAPKSFHCQGLALDLRPPDGVLVQDFWVDILRVADKAGIGGVGYASPSAGNYVHIDCRESPRVVQWRYPLVQTTEHQRLSVLS